MKKTSIGGQALIEGILMRGPDKSALAVRKKDGSIDLSYPETRRVKDRFPFLGWPVLRGIVNLVESLVQGYRAMMQSAEISGYLDLEEDEPPAAAEKTPVDADSAAENLAEGTEKAESTEGLGEDKPASQPEDDPAIEKGEAESLSKQKSYTAIKNLIMTVAAVLAVILCLALFIYLPALLFNLINRAAGEALTNWRSLFEGVVKMAIFVGYVAAVSCMKDIRRVFQYHGAEHKTIFCYEAGEPLTVENVRKQRRFHPRCGTSFLILMLIISILVSSALAIAVPAVTRPIWLWVIVKLLLIPVVCGLGYELIRVCGRHNNLLTRIVSAPGMWLQHITTKEPDDDMIEIAIAALEAVIPDDPDADRW